MDRPLLSIVVPAYRSQATLRPLMERVKAVLDPLTEGRWQAVLVNDASPDDTWKVISELCAQEPRVLGVNLTRNFGQHNAVMCGFAHATGEYLVTLDDDLQNPPEEIPRLYEEIQRGWDVVYGTIERRGDTPAFRNIGSKMVLAAFRRTFGVSIDITSFRILRRPLVQQILSYRRSFTFIDGLIAWHTTHIGSVPVAHHPRTHGKSGYSLAKLLNLTINMLTNFSLLPLRSATVLGFVFSLFGFAMAAFFLVQKLVQDIPVSGFASTIVAVTLLSGVQLLTVGILGEYIGRIHINISNRPQYTVRETLNAPPENSLPEDNESGRKRE